MLLMSNLKGCHGILITDTLFQVHGNYGKQDKLVKFNTDTLFQVHGNYGKQDKIGKVHQSIYYIDESTRPQIP